MASTRPTGAAAHKPAFWWINPAASLFAASIAETCCYPMDSVKTWLQINGKATPGTHPLRQVANVTTAGFRRGGFVGFFQGLPLAVARNALSTMIVMGWHLPLSGKVAQLGMGVVATKMVSSTSLSVMANCFLIPLETLKIRLQGDGQKVAAQRRYSSVLNSFRSFVGSNGVVALWTGSLPTFLRSALWWAVSIPVYTGVKRVLTDKGSGFGLGLEDGSPVHILCSVASGLGATIVSQPADMIKTRMQNQSNKARVFRNSFHCLYKVATTEGVPSLWRGIIPRYGRLGPWQLIFFVVFEQTLMFTTGRSYGT